MKVEVEIDTDDVVVKALEDLARMKADEAAELMSRGKLKRFQVEDLQYDLKILESLNDVIDYMGGTTIDLADHVRD